MTTNNTSSSDPLKNSNSYDSSQLLRFYQLPKTLSFEGSPSDKLNIKNTSIKNEDVSKIVCRSARVGNKNILNRTYYYKTNSAIKMRYLNQSENNGVINSPNIDYSFDSHINDFKSNKESFNSTGVSNINYNHRNNLTEFPKNRQNYCGITKNSYNVKKSTSVYLNVYDLEPNFSPFVNSILRSLGTGLFHAGVEVYGVEYSFGQTMDKSSGITRNPPKFHPVHIYRETVYMGETHLRENELHLLIACLKYKWPGISYNILKRNCLNFADQFCNLLGVGSVPNWVLSLQVGAIKAAYNMNTVATVIKQIDESVGITNAFKSVGNIFSEKSNDRVLPRL